MIGGMNNRHLLQIFFVPLLAVATGCAHEATYKVSVENKLEKPVTLWLVNDDGPAQDGWLSPEQVAEQNTSSDDHLPDVVLNPNQTARIGPISGQFYGDHPRASLRIYGGTPTLTQMLATGRGGLTRYDQLLEPGTNNLIIQENARGAIVTVKAATPTTKP